MKLKSLTLENFRQFHGKQKPIHFPEKTNQNVTVIFGANGAGKSTILNAFTWTFYYETSPSFENPDNIISEKAIREASEGDLINARVSVEFEHKGNIYIASRTRSEKKVDDINKTEIIEKGLPKLMIIGSDGVAEESNNPEDHLEQVLPRSLHRFFFFDGERIEQLAKDSAYQEVEHAIKNLLGLQILDRSISHLKKVKGILDARLSSVGAQEIQEIIKEIKSLEDKKSDEEFDQENLEKNIEADKEQLGAVKERLRTLEETKDLQEDLDEKETALEDIKYQILKKNNELKQLISRSGYSAFIEPFVKKGHEILEDKREKKELPSGIKKQFVQDLLSSAKCICGTDLKDKNNKPTSHYYKVEEWLNKAGSSEIEQHAISVGIQLNDLVERKENLFETIESLQADKSNLEEKKSLIVEKISELKHKLDDKDSEEIKELVNRRDELEQNIKNSNENIGAIKERIKIIDGQLEKYEEEKNEADAANDKANFIKRKLGIRKEALSFFEKVYSLMSEEVRKELDKRVRRVHGSISYKNFETEITKDFRLVLRKSLGEEVSKSTGESQITSLSFIGSIVDYARNFSKEEGINSLLGFEGGLYPIIMDSPFSNLDDNYRKSVAEGIPKLAEQIVIIVSKSQGQGIVLNQLKPRIDRAYLLSFETAKKEEYVEEDFKYSGKTYPYIKISDNNHEVANILELN